MSDKWNDLTFDIKTCTDCIPGPKVICRGNPEAKILIVGQAPGHEEAKQGKPFVGPAGQVLDKALASVGLTEKDVLITNPVFAWPRGPDDRLPTPAEIEHGHQHLLSMLELLKPGPVLIIALGAVAVRQFVNSPWGITRLSGQLQDGNNLLLPYPTFPIVHPAAILHNPSLQSAWDQAWRNLVPVLERLLHRDTEEEIKLTEQEWGPEQALTHLHVHSEYSKLDGHATIKELVREARRVGFRTLSLTDHGTLAGWISFYRQATEVGIKPILGVEAYLANSRANNADYMHLVMLAEDLAGYQTLIQLQSRASAEATGNKAILIWDDLEALNGKASGIVVLTGCTSGVVGKPALRNRPEDAKSNVERLMRIFGPTHVHLEVQGHAGWEPQLLVNEMCLQLAADLNLKLVATGDTHYVGHDGWEVQDIMLAIRDHQIIDYPGRFRYDIHDLWLKTTDEILEDLVASGLTEEQAQAAIANSRSIAESCNVEVPRGKNVLPKPPIPAGTDTNVFFRDIVEKGFQRRLPDKLIDSTYRERLAYELNLYESKGFVDYMLIVWDLVNWTKANGIATGPGRGSVAGSLVAYVLGITDVDPILHDIIMERFISEVRTDMPDIDLDFENEKRDVVVQHLQDTYGQNNVIRIGTDVRFKGRLVLRDIGRVMSIPREDIDPVSNAIIYRSGGDSRANYTIEDSFQQFEVCKRFDRKHPKVRQRAIQLEGRVHNYGTHASGVLLTPWTVTQWVPTEKRNGVLTTAWNMLDVEWLGLLKLDILGITGLSIMRVCLELVKERHNETPNLVAIPLNDLPTLAAFARRYTVGVFQFGSLGLQRLCERMFKARMRASARGVQLPNGGSASKGSKGLGGSGDSDDGAERTPIESVEAQGTQGVVHRNLQSPYPQGVSTNSGAISAPELPLTFEDLVALNTLHRPAMLNIGLHQEYVYRVEGVRPVVYLHPIQEKHLKNTYGIAMYQEQIMMICHELGGLTWEHVGLIRKIISKRQGVEIFSKARDQFVEGAVKNNCDPKIAAEIFTQMSHAGAYAFNRAHACAYTMLAYQQMWLKVHYPLEYHAALLACENVDEIKPAYIRSARIAGVTVLPPDVSRSKTAYSLDGDAIRCGLADIVNVGIAAATAITKKQPYTSFADFIIRIDRRLVHSRTVEHLIIAGAFRNLHRNTKALLAAWKEVTEQVTRKGLADAHRQRTLDGETAFLPSVMDRLRLLDLEEDFTPEEEEQLAHTVLRFPGAAHPIAAYADDLKLVHPSVGLIPINAVDTDTGHDSILVSGIVTAHNWKIEGLEGGMFREQDNRAASEDMEGHKYVHLNVEDGTDFILAHFDRKLYQKHKEALEQADGWPILAEGHVRAGTYKVVVSNFVRLDEWATKVRKGESLTPFERRLLRHPMLDTQPAPNGAKRIWHLAALWALGSRIRVLALPTWVKEYDKSWRVCLQDLRDGTVVSKSITVWSDAAQQFGEELRSGVPCLIDLLPSRDREDQWSVSLRHGCKVAYVGGT